jgi:hypothetical protein
MVLPYQQHQKIRQAVQKSQSSSSSNNLLDILKNKLFWIWDKAEHLKTAVETNQQCCFNHIVGCPTKAGREYPLFDYEKLLYDALMYRSVTNVQKSEIISDSNKKELALFAQNSAQNSFKDKHLYVLKSTGLGITEFMLRFMAWLCTKDNQCRNSQMVIVTGPNLDLAVKLVKNLSKYSILNLE